MLRGVRKGDVDHEKGLEEVVVTPQLVTANGHGNREGIFK